MVAFGLVLAGCGQAPAPLTALDIARSHLQAPVPNGSRGYVIFLYGSRPKEIRSSTFGEDNVEAGGTVRFVLNQDPIVRTFLRTHFAYAPVDVNVVFYLQSERETARRREVSIEEHLVSIGVQNIDAVLALQPRSFPTLIVLNSQGQQVEAVDSIELMLQCQTYGVEHCAGYVGRLLDQYAR
jgi:hypothetical protein